jgi:hypothetical protein
MSVTAKQMSQLCMKNRDIETIIKEQLQIIDDKLLHSDRGIGLSYITHSLPVIMVGINGMDKIDAQRIVYSTIICSLEKRGFTVKISLDDSSSIIYVAWKSELDQSSLDTMNIIIRNNRISKSELQSLIRK